MPSWNLSNETWFLIALIVIALALVLVLWMIRVSTNPKYCRKKVTGILKRFARLRQYKVLSGLTLSYEGKTARFDEVLIGFYGVSFVTCLAETASYYGQEREEKWSRVENETKKTYFPNPILAGEKGIELVRRILSSNGVYNIQMEHLIVFAGARKKTEVFIKSGTPTLTRSQLRQLLGKVKYEKDNSVDVEALASLLLNHSPQNGE